VAFGTCTSLERVVCGKNLKTICEAAFQFCSKLVDVQLASSSISFGLQPFAACDRLIEIAAAAGFPSNTFATRYSAGTNLGAGVVPYLLNRFERSERKRYVLVALMRFKNAVHLHDGDEKEKVAAAKQHHPRPTLNAPPILLHLQGQTTPDKDAEAVRRLQQDVVLQ